MTHHSIDVRIYYEDTDAGGIVYHASYIRFGERARTEFLRHIGHMSSEIQSTYNAAFVVKHLEIEYYKPTKLDDLLRVDTRIKTIKNTSFTMKHTIYRPENNQDILIAELDVVLVCVNTNTLKPVKLPELVKTKFENYL